MIDLIRTTFLEFGETFRVVDAIDIALVSVFIYAVLLWFQRTASRGVVLGVVSLAVVYFIARGLEMYLVSLAFQASFAVLLFVLVVVFQEDLRRLLERVSAIRSIQLGADEGISAILDTISESVFAMASARTGALIVLRGKEPLARHTQGGIPLDGEISKPLLVSIFDPSSPGHDGAVIVDQDRITQFAAHLPISKNVAEIAGRGTRHSAGLGLSECSDALVIVCSEERGTVSVAVGGQLTKVKTASDLRRRLEEYYEQTHPVASQSFLQRFVIQNGGQKIAAFAIAVIAWFVLVYDPHTIQRTFVIPVEYRNLNQQLELDATAPNEARVTLSGSERDFRFLDPGTLKITLDMAHAVQGFQEIPVTEKNIRLPTNLSLYRMEPRVLRLFLRPQPSASAVGN